MSFLQLAVRLSLCCALLPMSACGGRGRPRKDASTDPVGSGDGGVCGEAGCATGIAIHAEFNLCPSIGIVATPTQTYLDRPVMVTSRAVDPEGDALTYQWDTYPDSNFDNPEAPATYFRCESMGRKTIHLTVSDARGCEVDDEIEVSCVNVADFIMSGTQQIPGSP